MIESKIESYTLVWLSRPDPLTDGKQMRGTQSFETIDDAAKFMQKKLSVNSTFVSLDHTITIRNSKDATERMKEILREFGPVELREDFKPLYPDHVPVVF